MVRGRTNPGPGLQAMREGEGSLLKHDQELQMIGRGGAAGSSGGSTLNTFTNSGRDVPKRPTFADLELLLYLIATLDHLILASRAW